MPSSFYTKTVIAVASATDTYSSQASVNVSLPDGIIPRLKVLLSLAGVPAVTIIKVDVTPANSTQLDPSLLKSLNSEPETTLIMSIGGHALTRSLVSADKLAGLGPESFVIGYKSLSCGATLAAVDGVNWVDLPKSGTRKARDWVFGNRGLAYGVYAVLEDLGFAFMHPLAPTIPPKIATRNFDLLSRTESPRWTQLRAIHYHTQHPLELTPFLQGFGPKGPQDVQGWESQIPEWSQVCEWLVANRQNGFEWALLESGRWADFARCSERIERLKVIVDVGHSFGVMIGVDVPIAFAQQHSFRLLRNGTGKTSHLEAEKVEIRESLDWVMKAGFDFLGTENGTSEFTHVSPEDMLNWMNTASDYAAAKFSVPMSIKIHCSSGQVAKGYVDKRTGKDINYNMLPSFASKTLGILPHTVETYSLDDPVDTYGNKSFDYMRAYLKAEVEDNLRSVVYYPETCYWVSFDIDVPLFLPLYADRRLHDLQLIATDEQSTSSKNRMDGQLFFSSGWEWGYWLNDVIASRAAWDPKIGLRHNEALRASFAPFTRHLGEVRKAAEDVLADWCAAQKDLMIYGKLPGQEAPAEVKRRNGHAYLEGWDTWDDFSKLLGKLTQPDRLGLVELKHGGKYLSHLKNQITGKLAPIDEYKNIVAPLLESMDTTFTALADRTEALSNHIPTHFRDLWDDIADAGKMTALRSRQLRYLYAFVASQYGNKEGDLDLARKAMDCLRQGLTIVAGREKRYRVPVERIGSWTGLETNNPTAYAFNYLWTVHSLHLWWRDAAQAILSTSKTHQVAFANIIDPIEVGMAKSRLQDTIDNVAKVLSAIGLGKDFFDLAEKEPIYPRDIKHWKEL